MIYIDMGVLADEIERMEEEELENDDARLATLLGILAGDRGVLKRTTKECIAELFNDVDEILQAFQREELPFSDLGKLPLFVPKKRRRGI